MNPRQTQDEGMPGAFEGETVTRRRLLTTGAHATAAIAGAAIVLPVIGFAAGPMFQRPRASWQPVGRPDEFPDDTYVTRIIESAPDVGEAGKATIFVRRRNPHIDVDPADR